MKILFVSMKVSEKTAHKYKQSVFVIGALLAVAISLNLYQYLNTAHSVLDKSHDIQKEVIHEGKKWTEIRTKAKDYDKKGQYELWLTLQGAQPELIEIFGLDRFSDLTWQMNSKSGITVSYWFGGTEGGMRETIIYSYMGDEQVRISQEFPNGRDFTFGKLSGPLYTVSYITDGACVGNIYESVDVPEVAIQGILVTSRRSKVTSREFLLAEASVVKCGAAFEGYHNPTLKITNSSDDKIDFELANKKTATITYGSVKTPEVIFNE